MLPVKKKRISFLTVLEVFSVVKVVVISNGEAAQCIYVTPEIIIILEVDISTKIIYIG